MKIIAITGGAGHIAYSLLFRLASGELFGEEQIELRLLELPHSLGALEGIKMELDDCSFPLLKKIVCTDDPYTAFESADFIFFVGARPRTKGMERKELISSNASIFAEHGKALNKVASRGVTSLVVGNPCNTNCLVLMKNAPDLKNFHAMTRLDQNRAQHQLAAKAGCNVDEVKNLTIWGNHSSTQVPDFVNATIRGERADRVIDRTWLESTFIETVQNRGAQILEARGLSSAASAASAAIDAAKSIVKRDQVFSSCVYSMGNSYGIDEDLIFSFPVGPEGIIADIPWDDYLSVKIRASEKELQEEREAVRDLL